MLLYVAPSVIHGSGLFAGRLIAKDEEICAIFNRIAESGTFNIDYRQNLYGQYINHSEKPNTKVVLIKNGVGLTSLQTILPNTELTANYQQMIELFNHDASLVQLIKFWQSM